MNTDEHLTRNEYLAKLYDKCSRQSFLASDVARKLAFAAGAGCWVLRSDDLQFPILILMAFCVLCVFFILDISQYFSTWQNGVKLFDLMNAETPLPPNAERLISVRHRKIANNFFSAKMIFLFLTYFFMALEVINRALLLTTQIQPTSSVGG